MNIEIVDNKSFSMILVEGEPWKKIHRRLYKNHLREILRVSSKKDLIDLCSNLDVKIGRGIVYKLLALKGYMRSELEAKLKARYIAPEAIEKILAECERLGYLNDKREAKLFIDREKRRGSGARLIAYKLDQKAPALKEMVKELVSEEEQEETIAKWIEKKVRSNDDLRDFKVKARLYRFLKGKGFSEELIRKHLRVD